MHHENYVLEDALSLVKCFISEDGSWSNDLYLTSLCALALLHVENKIRSQTRKWIRNDLLSLKEMNMRELLKDKHLILGAFLGTKIVLKEVPEFHRQILPLLEDLIDQLNRMDWNNDSEYPSIILFSLSDIMSAKLETARKYLLNNIYVLMRQGRRRSAIFSLLGLLQFEEGRKRIAELLKTLIGSEESGLVRLDIRSNAILLFVVAEMDEKYRYLLYDRLEKDLRKKFLEIRNGLLMHLYSQLQKAVIKEKSVLSGKERVVGSLEKYSQLTDPVSIKIPYKVVKALFEKPHMSDLAFSIIAIKKSLFDDLYSFDKQTFTWKCKPALEPSKYIPVEKKDLVFFISFVVIAISSLTVLSYLLSNPAIIFVAIALSVLSIGFARKYFSQLISELFKKGKDESS